MCQPRRDPVRARRIRQTGRCCQQLGLPLSGRSLLPADGLARSLLFLHVQPCRGCGQRHGSRHETEGNRRRRGPDSRRRSTVRYRSSDLLRGSREATPDSLYLLRQRGLHEHGRPEERVNALWSEDQDNCAGKHGQGEEHRTDRCGSRRRLHRHRFARIPRRHDQEGEEGQGIEQAGLHSRYLPVPARVGV